MGPREPSFFQTNLKLGASKLDDNAQVTSEQEYTKLKLSREKTIDDLKKDPLVKLVLKMLGESDKGNKGTLDFTSFDDQESLRIAEVIAEKIFPKKKSNPATRLKLASFVSKLEKLAEQMDKYDDLRSGIEEAERRVAVPAPRMAVPPPLILTGGSPAPARLKYPKNIALEKIAKNVGRVSERYYNNTPINEIDGLEADDDPKATPANLFKWDRITKFVGTLQDESAKYKYFLEIHRKLIVKDESGCVRVMGVKQFSGDKHKDLHRKLNDKISIYVRTGAMKAGDGKKKEPSDFNLRRKIMIFVPLVFGQLEIPTSKYTQERIVDLCLDLFGGDRKTVREILGKPYRHNPEKKQSIKRLRVDVEFVQSQLYRAGFYDAAKLVSSELDEIRNDQTNFEDEDDLFNSQ